MNCPIVLQRSKQVRAQLMIASFVLSSPHLRSGTVAARDCKRATGSKLEFINVTAAIAKFLAKQDEISICQMRKQDTFEKVSVRKDCQAARPLLMKCRPPAGQNYITNF